MPSPLRFAGLLEWDTPDGSIRVIDLMPPHGTAADVVQIVEGVSGRVPVRMAMRLRFDYGRIVAGCAPSTADRQTFTRSYGSTGLDAALLLIPQVGFLPWDDPRVLGTVHQVQRRLYRDGFVMRSDTGADGGVDGLPGSEGSFLACTFWLADAWHGIGRRQQVIDLFERLLGLRNDVGLLSEEYDTAAHRQIGNVPQAYSHVGLINTARRLSGTPATAGDHGRAPPGTEPAPSGGVATA